MEKSRFFNSTVTDKRSYSAADFAEFIRTFYSDGVMNGGDKLQVAKSSNALSVTVSPGMAMIQGYWYANTAALALPLQAASATLPRIDRVVLHLDLTSTARKISLAVVTGTPAVSPYPPNLTRDDNVYELSLAQLSIPAGAGTVASVTDERYNGAVCGITHGLYTVDLTELQEEHQSMLADVRAQAQAAINEFESTGGTVFADRIKAVDGPGSGIDADLLDGKHGSYYAHADHTHTLSALGAQKTISAGTAAPNGGVSGDIYIQY